MEGDGITGKTVPLCSTAYTYVMCSSFPNDTACVCAIIYLIYGVLGQIYQQISGNYFYCVIFFQMNLYLPIRKFILDCICLTVLY